MLASYQAVSGAGQAGVDTLHDQLAKVAGDRALGSRAGNVRQAVGDDLGPFPAPLALNVVPWAGSLRDGGWSSEELKVRNESRKILGLPDLKVSATCVRVPVVTGHSVAVHAVFGSEVDAEGAREVLRNAPGVILVDDPAAGEFPMPIDAVGTDPSWVGRIRRVAGRPARAGLLRHRRQPAQGRRPQHRPDRRTAGQGPNLYRRPLTPLVRRDLAASRPRVTVANARRASRPNCKIARVRGRRRWVRRRRGGRRRGRGA